MSVLGIDPGVHRTGWAYVEGDSPSSARLVAAGLIETLPSAALPARLLRIHSEMAEVLATYPAREVAVEEFFFLKAARTIRNTLQARGAILLAAAQAGRGVWEYNPRQVKLSLTGSGTAAKPQMQRIVARRLGGVDLRPDDVADAAAIALCHLGVRRFTSRATPA